MVEGTILAHQADDIAPNDPSPLPHRAHCAEIGVGTPCAFSQSSDVAIRTVPHGVECAAASSLPGAEAGAGAMPQETVDATLVDSAPLRRLQEPAGNKPIRLSSMA